MRIELPSYLSSAAGRIDDIVLYSSYGKEYARRYVKPANPGTEGQKIIRKTFGDAVRSWQVLPDEEKRGYNRKARRLSISGYNLYISLYMEENIPSSAAGTVIRNSIPSSGSPLDTPRLLSPSVSAPFCVNNGLYSDYRLRTDGSGPG